MSKKILSCVLVALMASVSFGATFEMSADPVADGVNLIYSPDSGDMTLMSGAALTTVEIKSAGGNFTGVKPASFDNAFDVATAVKLFHLSTTGFTELAMPGTGKTGLGGEALLADLTIDGSFLAGGNLDNAAIYLVHPEFVPEPSSLALLCLGVLGMLGIRRK